MRVVAVCDDTYVASSAGDISCRLSPGVGGTWSFIEMAECGVDVDCGTGTGGSENVWESVDPVVAGQLFAVGFIIYGTAWAIGKSVGIILDVIRRI